jgi:hypothetical protein
VLAHNKQTNELGRDLAASQVREYKLILDKEDFLEGLKKNKGW